MAVNQQHLELCSSAEWAETVSRFIIPWVLDGLELGDHVLEVGPGPGRTTEVLVAMVPRLTAVDLDAALARDLGARLVGPGFEAVNADATALPQDDATFSAVLSFTMLHHLPSPQAQDAVFSEAARVLRPGGVFAGTDSLDQPEFRQLHVDDICVPIDPDTLGARLERAGLERVEVITNDFGVRFRGWLPAS
jgi:ubiquinone/menaquinone biosynthesis C-methylase UbiE